MFSDHYGEEIQTRESRAILGISSWLRDAPDIYKFPIMHIIKTAFLLRN